MRLLVLLVLICALAGCAHAQTTEFQWSIPVESVINSETNDHPRAWLYIPPTCKRVRAVVVGQHNLLEETVFNNPVFRHALADNDMAVVWISPSLDGVFRSDKGAGEHFNGMMKALAQESGYGELEWAPIVPIGHSAMAGYPYEFAAWAPERTLVAISIKGQWPDYRNPTDFDFDNSRLNGVPLLYIGGEYEDANGRAAKAANFRKSYPLSPLTMLADVGAGHFDFHDRLASYMALYLREVAKYRLPKISPVDGPVKLNPIDPTKSGWLYDRWRSNQAPLAPPAPLDGYTGPKDEAFWAFDGELAKATNDYTQIYQNKKPELLGYIQNNGPVLEQNPKAHEQVQLKMVPLEDGSTFKITGAFIDTVPDGRPPSWTELPVGSSITHAPDGGPIDIEVTTGPLQKVNADTFAIRFGRIGFNNSKRGGDIWFQATQDGGSDYKRAVQQALLRIPIVNKNGADQSLTFPAIGDQKLGATPIRLTATSTANVPVSYYVETGPAEIDGDTLKFLPIPARAKMPVKVTVVAYQWGRSIEPKLKSAAQISRTFTIGKAADAAQIQRDKMAREAVWADVSAKVALLAPAPLPVVNAIVTAQLPLTAANAGRALSFNFAKKLGMDNDDLAGSVVRVSHWNNLLGVEQGKTTELGHVFDSGGHVVPGLIVTVLGGSTSYNNNAFDARADAADSDNDSRLFNGAYDQDDGAPTSIHLVGIPFEHYDLIFYRADDGANRAGKFTVGTQTLYARGGKPNPDNNGANYASVYDPTPGQGKDIDQGNVIRFANLSGSTLDANFQAVNAGDDVQRNKVVGFQIVDRK